MDNFSRRQEFNTDQPKGLLGKLRVFHGLLYWLVNLLQLTEEEQRDAGILIGDQRYD